MRPRRFHVGAGKHRSIEALKAQTAVECSARRGNLETFPPRGAPAIQGTCFKRDGEADTLVPRPTDRQCRIRSGVEETSSIADSRTAQRQQLAHQLPTFL